MTIFILFYDETTPLRLFGSIVTPSLSSRLSTGSLSPLVPLREGNKRDRSTSEIVRMCLCTPRPSAVLRGRRNAQTLTQAIEPFVRGLRKNRARSCRARSCLRG